jgi:uncharacterized protein (TIGR02285 family)
MNQRHVTGLCVSLLLLAACVLAFQVRAAAAQERDIVIWPYFSFPPHVIVGADGTLSGASVELQRLMTRALPEYRHERINSPVNRSMLAAREGQPYCLTGLLRRPDRERILSYSLPCRLVPPQVAVTVQGLLDAHKNADGQVSMKSLLQDGRLTYGHIKGFSHGQALDRIIEENYWRENVFEILDMKTLGRQLELLLSGRIQYFITTPEQAWYALREQGLFDHLEMIRVAEAQEWDFGYIACTRGEWGREVVGKINAAIRRSLRNGELRNIYRRNFPAQLWPEFDSAWDRLMAPIAEEAEAAN